MLHYFLIELNIQHLITPFLSNYFTTFLVTPESENVIVIIKIDNRIMHNRILQLMQYYMLFYYHKFVNIIILISQLIAKYQIYFSEKKFLRSTVYLYEAFPETSTPDRN